MSVTKVQKIIYFMKAKSSSIAFHCFRDTLFRKKSILFSYTFFVRRFHAIIIYQSRIQCIKQHSIIYVLNPCVVIVCLCREPHAATPGNLPEKSSLLRHETTTGEGSGTPREEIPPHIIHVTQSHQSKSIYYVSMYMYLLLGMKCMYK